MPSLPSWFSLITSLSLSHTKALPRERWLLYLVYSSSVRAVYFTNSLALVTVVLPAPIHIATSCDKAPPLLAAAMSLCTTLMLALMAAQMSAASDRCKASCNDPSQLTIDCQAPSRLAPPCSVQSVSCCQIASHFGLPL